MQKYTIKLFLALLLFLPRGNLDFLQKSFITSTTESRHWNVLTLPAQGARCSVCRNFPTILKGTRKTSISQIFNNPG